MQTYKTDPKAAADHLKVAKERLKAYPNKSNDAAVISAERYVRRLRDGAKARPSRS